MQDFSEFLAGDGAKLGLTLLLSFLMGFERERQHREGDTAVFLGGVRTFPLIGLLGLITARLAGDSPALLAVGLVVVGAFALVSYTQKIWKSSPEIVAASSMANEASALLTFLMGALVFRGDFWIATTIAVLGALILELRRNLEDLSAKIPESEIFTFTQFLLLSAVILPVVPNHEYTQFALNPFKIWLVVAVISTISYAAYALGRLLGDRGSVLASAILGGAYSSTMTTLILAKRTEREDAPRLFSGAILIASGMMYFRLVALLAVLNPEVAAHLALAFLSLGALAVIAGFLWSRTQKTAPPAPLDSVAKNPLEIKSAIFFAVLFVVMAVLTRFVQSAWGTSGVYGLALISGLSDVDPFIMSLTQSAGKTTELNVAANAIVLATISNNLLKAAYTLSFAKGRAKLLGAGFLAALALLGLAAFYFIS